MKQTTNEKWEAEMAEKNAARMLLKDYVINHPGDVVFAIENIIPFFSECSLIGLQKAMNTVNATFAAVALDVVKASSEEDDNFDRLQLPVDAEDMKTAIYYLSRFIALFGPLSNLASNTDEPAIKMCRDAFGKVECRG